MKLLITEKPSVAMEFAKALKINTSKKNELSYIKVSDSTLEPEFRSDVYSYNVSTDKDSVMITCGLENSSSNHLLTVEYKSFQFGS